MDLVIPVIPVQRGIEDRHTGYLASFTFGDIARLLDDGRLYIPNHPELPDFAQRKLNLARIKVIAQYILETYQTGTTFFPPVCINVQPSPSYRSGHIYLPYHAVALRLTDGQHRCFAIRQAIHNIRTQDLIHLSILEKLEVGVLLYAGLPLELERQAFRDQNLLAQRPGTSISHLFDQRSPSVLIAKSLMETVPQFRDNVETIENGLGKHNPKLLSLSTLVIATKYMFPNIKSTQDLEKLTDWATTFWCAVAKNLPNALWDKCYKDDRAHQREETLAVSAVAFQALGLLAHDLYTEGVFSRKLEQWLGALQNIDWKRSNALWLEKGVIQVGAKGVPIISNTRTTVNACHCVLREFVGVSPVSGLIG